MNSTFHPTLISYAFFRLSHGMTTANRITSVPSELTRCVDVCLIPFALNADTLFKQPNSQAWTTGFDHQAYLTLTKYYATAWKTGTYPAITKNQIFLTARPHSKNAVCTSDSVARPTNAAWVSIQRYKCRRSCSLDHRLD